MGETRREKVATNIMTTIASMLNNGSIKNPRLGFITVTSIEVTGDLRHVRVYYTAYGDGSIQNASATTLASAKGVIRSRVGRDLGTRLTPTPEFRPDPLPAQAAAVGNALAAAQQADAQLATRKGKTYADEADPYKKPHNSEAE